MGYNTNFFGEFILDKPLSDAHAAYLLAFSDSRRMKRNVAVVEKMNDPIREAAGLPIGTEGEFFIGEKEYDHFSGGSDKSVIDCNRPPSTQPGLWCQWIPYEGDTSEIVWDGGEKFYNYVEWIEYIIENMLKPWGYTLNGEVSWEGDERGDLGKIIVDGNKVEVLEGKIYYE